MNFKQLKYACKYFIIAILLCVNNNFAQGQNVNLLFPYLQEKERKVIDDAMEDMKKAGDLVQEANQYYSEALGLQLNTELDESTLQKKLGAAESKAINTQLKADKIYRSASKKVIEICLKTIGSNESLNEEALKYKNEAEQMMAEAEGKRKATSDAQNVYEKATLLNDASGLESAAIDNYISAIAVSNNDELPQALSNDDQLTESEIKTEILISLKDTTYKSTSTSSDENLSVDQQMINKYNNYVNDPTIADPIMIDGSGIHGIAADDMEGLRDYYNSYRTGELEYESTSQVISTDATSSTETYTETSDIGIQSTESVSTDNLITTDNTSGYKESVTSSAGEVKQDYSVRTQQLKQEYDISEGQDNTVRFMVQIAASRIPLTRSQLWAIYPGNLTVEVFHIGNWYKYRITGFRLFSEANRIAIESGVSNAWVLSTSNGQEINLVKARELTRNLEEQFVKNSSKSAIFNADYYVQVAASRTPISDENLKNICNEMGTCREIIEEGWFKYQYYGGTTFNEAMNLSKSLTRKSFIVAYRGGTKINLYKAKKRENK